MGGEKPPGGRVLRGDGGRRARHADRFDLEAGGLHEHARGFTEVRPSAEFVDALKLALDAKPVNFGEDYGVESL